MNLEDHLKLENQLCFPLYVTSRLLTRAYQPLLAKLGITYPQYLVLLVLWEQDGVTVSQISEKLYLNSNTLTPLLKRMEKQEIISRKRVESDERQVLITLSEKGLALKKDAQCIPENLFAKINLPSKELGQFRKTLSRLLHHLDDSEQSDSQ